MQGWAKIVIEFQPERHNANELMAELLARFQDETGVPTATVTLSGFGEDLEEDALLLNMSWSSAPVMRRADQIVGIYGPMNMKIQAIKELRTVTGLGLKEAKNAIDLAWTRGGF